MNKVKVGTRKITEYFWDCPICDDTQKDIDYPGSRHCKVSGEVVTVYCYGCGETFEVDYE